MDATQNLLLGEAHSFRRVPPVVLSQVMMLPAGVSVDEMLKVIEMSIFSLTFLHYGNSGDLMASQLQLGILFALCLSSRMTAMSETLTGKWENVLWKITYLVKSWKESDDMDFSSLESTPLKSWILAVFTDPELCPNPFLRLEMIRFVSILPENFYQDAASGTLAAAGLVRNSLYINYEHLMPGNTHQTNMFYSFVNLLSKLNNCGHLDEVAAAAERQVMKLEIGPETLFFNHLLQVLEKSAKAGLHGYRIGRYREHTTSFLLRNVLYLYNMLVVTLPTVVAYGAPGLAQASAACLIAITTAIVTFGSWLQLEYQNKRGYVSVVFCLDNIYKTIAEQERSKSLSQVLRLEHHEYLCEMSKKAAEDGPSFHHHFPAPCQESSSEVPQEFIDSMTQAVMEAPMLLHSSNMVIDKSTLVRLLLRSPPSDPFTRVPLGDGSFSSLHDLQETIRAWRERPPGDHSCLERAQQDKQSG